MLERAHTYKQASIAQRRPHAARQTEPRVSSLAT
jgi:hypothetical protein